MNLLQIFPMRLNEVHWTDSFPKGFADFRKKYLQLSRAKQTYNLYVQFTHNNSNMDRNAWQQTDHSDPVGTYGYFMDYVLKYPADVWYASGARYLRVLQDTSKRTLFLQSITSENDVYNLLRKMGFNGPQVDEMIHLVTKHYKDRIKNPNKWGKVAFQAIQIDLLAGPTGETKPGMFSKGSLDFRIRTGQEQTALLLKAGYDSVQDQARTSSGAVINDREPEQIIFLNRGAFRIVDVFALRPGIPADQLPGMTTNDPDTPRITRPLVAAIAKMMDDQIVEWSEDPKTKSKFDRRYDCYWTKKGRRIKVRFDRPSSYYQNRQLGSKKHKEAKLSSNFYTTIEITSEHGTMTGHISSDKPFKDGVASLAWQWHELQKKPIDQEWKPETGTSFMQGVTDERNKKIHASLKKERDERLAKLPQTLEDISWVAERLDMPFKPADDYERNANIRQSLDWLSNFIRHRGYNSKEPLSDTVEHWRTSTVQDDFPDLSVQLQQLADIIMKASTVLKDNYWQRYGDDMFKAMRQVFQEQDAKTSDAAD